MNSTHTQRGARSEPRHTGSTKAATATTTHPRRTTRGLLSAGLIVLVLGAGGVALGSRSDERASAGAASTKTKTQTTDRTGTARDLVCDRVPPRPTVPC